jgi:putative glutathione S-transferase
VGFTWELYQWPGVAPAVNMGHIKEHYYRSHTTINPNGIVPMGPILDLDRPITAAPEGKTDGQD